MKIGKLSAVKRTRNKSLRPLCFYSLAFIYDVAICHFVRICHCDKISSADIWCFTIGIHDRIERGVKIPPLA